MYERDDALFKKAANLHAKQGSGSPDAKILYHKAHKRIKEHAKDWGLHWQCVSSMLTVLGPFASVFYPRQDAGAPNARAPYIALVFKGL